MLINALIVVFALSMSLIAVAMSYKRGQANAIAERLRREVDHLNSVIRGHESQISIMREREDARVNQAIRSQMIEVRPLTDAELDKLPQAKRDFEMERRKRVERLREERYADNPVFDPYLGMGIASPLHPAHAVVFADQPTPAACRVDSSHVSDAASYSSNSSYDAGSSSSSDSGSSSSCGGGE